MNSNFVQIVEYKNGCFCDQINGANITPGQYDVLWPNGEITRETIQTKDWTDDAGRDSVAFHVSYVDLTVRGAKAWFKACGLKVRPV